MTPRQQRIDDPEKLEELRHEMERRHSIMTTMKIAYMNSSVFGERVPTPEDVRAAAQSFIEANYTYQRAVYGRVRVKLSAANLLRW
jgi:hypothetical protein